jgi:hypothetical protein
MVLMKIPRQNARMRMATPQGPGNAAMLRFTGTRKPTVSVSAGSEVSSSLASQSIPSWNQIIAWLKEMEALRAVAA